MHHPEILPWIVIAVFLAFIAYRIRRKLARVAEDPANRKLVSKPVWIIWLLVLIGLLLLIKWSPSKRPVEEQPVSPVWNLGVHADGDLRSEVKIHVVDDQSGLPVAGVSIVYLSRMELLMLRVELKTKNPVNTTEPKGVAGTSDAAGGVTLRCLFDAAFYSKWQGDKMVPSRTEVFPDGEFRVSKSGYVSRNILCCDLFSKPPYPPEALRQVEIVLSKDPSHL